MTQLDLQQRLEQALISLEAEKSHRNAGWTCAKELEAERDALQQTVNSLTAENSSLHQFISEKCYTLEDDWETSGFVTDACQSLPKNPATDAVINEWMAQGVEKLLEYFPPYYTARSDIEKFLINLRAQGASNEKV